MWPSHTRNTRTDSNPFPWRQMLVLGLCRLCEPIAFMSIFPYVYFMVESFHITDNEREITFYAGTVTAAFTFAEFLAAMAWGAISDKVGRKPVLLCGIAGTGLSMVMFGLSKNLPMAIVARALGGLLNGNIGVINAAVSDIVTTQAHRARGFTMMPFVWCIGTIIGAGIGGGLADPVRNHGWSEGSIFATFPFLLPNLVCSAVVVFGLIFGLLFLEESSVKHKYRRDLGLEAGQWILSTFSRQHAKISDKELEVRDEQQQQLLDETEIECLPDYDSAAAAPRLSSVSAPDSIPPPAYQSKEGTPRSSISEHATARPLLKRDLESGELSAATTWRDVFNNQILLQLAAFGVLAYHTITAEQLLPVMFSQPESEAPINLPFFFTGGLGWELKTVGGVLASQGFIQMAVNLAIYPWLSVRISPLRLLRIINCTYPLLYIAIPYLVLLPHSLRIPCVYGILVWKVTWQAIALPSSQLIIASHVTRNMGTVQGGISSSASLSRAIGPLVAGTVQAAGLSYGAIGLPWWVTAAVTCLGALLSTFMVYTAKQDDSQSRTSVPTDDDDDTTEALARSESDVRSDDDRV